MSWLKRLKSKDYHHRKDLMKVNKPKSMNQKKKK